MPDITSSNFTEAEWEVIEKHAPCLVFDDEEPFHPLKIGCSIIYKTQHPPSLKQFYHDNPFHYVLKKLEVIALNFIYGRPPVLINLIQRWFFPISTAYYEGMRVKRAAKVIEYAIFYLTDIQHVYDLEHVWVYLDKNDNPLAVRGTQHGMVVYLYGFHKPVNMKNGHPILIVSPGKHAHYTNANQLHAKILTAANRNPGTNGMYRIQFFTNEEWKEVQKVYPGKIKLRLYYDINYSYTPSFRFRTYLIPKRSNTRKFGQLVPWDDLRSFIPKTIISHLKHIKEAEI